MFVSVAGIHIQGMEYVPRGNLMWMAAFGDADARRVEDRRHSRDSHVSRALGVNSE